MPGFQILAKRQLGEAEYVFSGLLATKPVVTAPGDAEVLYISVKSVSSFVLFERLEPEFGAVLLVDDLD